MIPFLHSASATTLMALKILSLLVFQNKPLVLFTLACQATQARFQVMLYLFSLRRFFPFT
ncbi:hypothetical protein ACO2Q8_04430 [Larkinella sp. VNQ87]|uniref:hypothetical protein n=1 Tax=Larkinella sp. VNQ87 TaxID=3400921 RepID=UPI003BFCAE3D